MLHSKTNLSTASYEYFRMKPIDCITGLLSKEYFNSTYFNFLSDVTESIQHKNILSTIALEEKYHFENLKRIYYELFSKNYISSQESNFPNTNLQNSVSLCILQKFEILKMYNALLDDIDDNKKLKSILSIMNDEQNHLHQLNFILLNITK